MPVLFVGALLASGAPGRRPAISRVGELASSIGLGGIGIVAGLTLSLGLALHPLQFGFTQLLEGYWGTGQLARGAMEKSATRHHDRWYDLASTAHTADAATRDIDLVYSDLASRIAAHGGLTKASTGLRQEEQALRARARTT